MGGRWSKPHVSTPSLHSLFDLRSAIHKGTCLVELELELCPSHDESQSQSSCEQQTASLDRLAGKPAIHKASSTSRKYITYCICYRERTEPRPQLSYTERNSVFLIL